MNPLPQQGPTGRPKTATRVLGIYRSQKRRAFSKMRLGYERTKQVFLLPGCYRKVRAYKECRKSGPALALDLLTWFFSYRTFPSHYAVCRLWEVDRKDWGYYFGSNYQPHQQARLRKTVQPFEYRVLFNDKRLCVLLCQALGFRTPVTHGLLDPAGDFRARLAEWMAASSARKLIIKPLAAFGGRGIVLAEPAEKGIMVRDGRTTTSLADFVLEGRALVQDVLVQDPRMSAFSPSSVNTLRIVTMMTPQNDVLLVNGSFRSGVGGSLVDNWSAGGVSVGIDCRNGVLKKFAYDRNSRRHAVHPSSGIVFEGSPVPEWGRVVETAKNIQRAFSFFRLIGLDIALDEDGRPVVIEINHGPDLAGLEQKAGPLLKDEAVLRAFGEYDLLVNRHQRRLYKAARSNDQANRSF